MNLQRAVSLSRLLLILLCIAFVMVTAVYGFSIGNYTQRGVFEEGVIKLGLDLAGGSSLTYQAQTTDTGETLASGIASSIQVMRQRCDSYGLTEANVYSVGDDKITVEIPSVTNPEEAAKMLMATAKLTFKDKDGNIVLEGSDVASAKYSYGVVDETNIAQHFVTLDLNDEGAKKFQEATRKAAQNEDPIYIYMDDQLLSSPTVSSKYKDIGIEGGSAIITGNFTEESAKSLAGQINAGALRYTFINIDQRTIGATLGEKSLQLAIQAGIITFILIIIYMIVIYRVPGVVAAVSLIGYLAIFFHCLVWFKVNLTLPGIAGMILSIGMCVDGNIVVFERIKDELRLGKGVKAAIISGHKRAIPAVVDSNLTQIIASLVLIWLGSGTILGFAYTLLIGSATAMFTVLLLSKWLLNLGFEIGLTQLWMYGGKKAENATTAAAENNGKKFNFHFIKNKKVSYSILVAIIILGIASFFIRSFVIDYDFSGGSELQVNLGTEVTDEICKKINGVIADSIGPEYVSSTLPSTADSNVVIIRTGTNPLTLDQQTTLKNALKEAFPNINYDHLQFNVISPIVGEDLKQAAILSVLVALGLMILYIWYRFKLASGISCILCLLHDLFVMITFYSLLQIPVNITIIATLLTIIGYSVNATIIIFDRIRENEKLMGEGMSFPEVVNLSIHQTLTRNISTTIVVLITAVTVYIFGVDSIRNFALPLIVGVIAGLFSSVFLSGVLWVEGTKIFKTKSKDGKKVKAAKKAKAVKASK